MELQERLDGEIREAEARFKTARGAGRSQDEAIVRKKLAAVEQELAGVRGRAQRAGQRSPAALLADYERIAPRPRRLAVAAGERHGVLRRLPRDDHAPRPSRSSARTTVADALRELRPLPLLAGGAQSRLSPVVRLHGRRLQRQPRARAAGPPSSSRTAPSASSPAPSRTPPTSAWSSAARSRASPPSPAAAASALHRQRLRHELLPRSLVREVGEERLGRRREEAGDQPRPLGAR